VADESKTAKPAVQPAERICVVIGRTRHKMVQLEIHEAAKRGARMIELRLDFLSKAPDFKRLLDKKPCSMLATVRRPEDGGRWPGTEEARQTLLRQCIVSGFDWVDLETDVADTIRRFRDVKRLVSYHNMREVPGDLEKIHERMCSQDADVVKVAVRLQHPDENLRLLNLVKTAKKPTVALGMGDLGMPARVLGAKYGSPFTYAAFNKERGIAPGLPSFDELHKVYHYDRFNADTQVFGVIGDPVTHSLSPLIHNYAYRQLGVNAVYVPFRVPRDTLEQFLRDFDVLPVQGYSVTIPHKEEAAKLARVKDPTVEQTGAANTLLRRGEGEGVHWAAFNSDYSGAIESLLASIGQQKEGEETVTTLQSRPTLILGAGGVARAIAHALHREGALITIASRTTERSRKLAEELLNARYLEWTARHSVPAQILVNCTPVGMHPKVDENPVHPSFLKPGQLVFDTVYTPETTLLVKEARSRGCQVVTGVDFFVRQAAAQVRLFTGKEPPIEAMYKLVKRALSPVTIKETDEG
jgi:3-dehydroquinate dehydratase/shikimate dehydrogenase